MDSYISWYIVARVGNNVGDIKHIPLLPDLSLNNGKLLLESQGTEKKSVIDVHNIEPYTWSVYLITETKTRIHNEIYFHFP